MGSETRSVIFTHPGARVINISFEMDNSSHNSTDDRKVSSHAAHRNSITPLPNAFKQSCLAELIDADRKPPTARSNFRAFVLLKVNEPVLTAPKHVHVDNLKASPSHIKMTRIHSRATQLHEPSADARTSRHAPSRSPLVEHFDSSPSPP